MSACGEGWNEWSIGAGPAGTSPEKKRAALRFYPNHAARGGLRRSRSLRALPAALLPARSLAHDAASFPPGPLPRKGIRDMPGQRAHLPNQSTCVHFLHFNSKNKPSGLSGHKWTVFHLSPFESLPPSPRPRGVFFSGRRSP